MRRIGFITLMVLLSSVLYFQLASGGSSGEWINKCAYSHTNHDDPIIYPGQVGASHEHDYLGADDTNANSTVRSMRRGGTTCTLKADTAGYWFPSFYVGGVHSLPTEKEEIYYKDDNLNSGTPITTFPRGFKLVAGNSHATSVSDNPKLGSELYFGCSDNSTGKLTSPPKCSTGIISVHIGFPNCWTGVNAPGNDTGELVYPSGGKCPSDHPVALPRVIIRLEIPATSTNIALSSGPTYTLHGDFWQTWHQRKLNQLVATCLNQDTDCGVL